MEDSVDVKIETNGARKTTKQNPVSKGGKRVCRVLGYITGDMKEFEDWLRGNPLSCQPITAHQKAMVAN